MRRFSACIEMLYRDEADRPEGRVAPARRDGLAAVEFWKWSDKDIPAMKAALASAGMPLAAIVSEPFLHLTDAAATEPFRAALRKTIAAARELGAPILIAQSGPDLEGQPRPRQRAALVKNLRAAAEELRGTGIRLALEPLNDRVDHPGYFLTDTAEALDIVDEAAAPEIGITFDLYHSAVMDETPEAALGGRVRHVLHAHIADHPGRNEPGSGGIDLMRGITYLESQGYSGPFGLEFRPTGSTRAAVAQTLARLGVTSAAS